MIKHKKEKKKYESRVVFARPCDTQLNYLKRREQRK